MNVLRVAAARDDIAVAVVQCRWCTAPRRRAAWAWRRLCGSLRSSPRTRCGPCCAEGGATCRSSGRRAASPLSPSPAPKRGWNSTVPPGGQFENRVAAADAVGLVVTSALRHARDITAPLLVCVCDRENLIDPKYVELAARRAPRGVALHYDSDHFEIYHPPLVEPGARRPNRLSAGASRCPCMTF